jgi:hypothetical protein
MRACSQVNVVSTPYRRWEKQRAGYLLRISHFVTSCQRRGRIRDDHRERSGGWRPPQQVRPLLVGEHMRRDAA